MSVASSGSCEGAVVEVGAERHQDPHVHRGSETASTRPAMNASRSSSAQRVNSSSNWSTTSTTTSSSPGANSATAVASDNRSVAPPVAGPGRQATQCAPPTRRRDGRPGSSMSGTSAPIPAMPRPAGGARDRHGRPTTCPIRTDRRRPGSGTGPPARRPGGRASGRPGAAGRRSRPRRPPGTRAAPCTGCAGRRWSLFAGATGQPPRSRRRARRRNRRWTVTAGPGSSPWPAPGRRRSAMVQRALPTGGSESWSWLRSSSARVRRGGERA